MRKIKDTHTQIARSRSLFRLRITFFAPAAAFTYRYRYFTAALVKRY